jgi:hypothetical protein
MKENKKKFFTDLMAGVVGGVVGVSVSSIEPVLGAMAGNVAVAVISNGFSEFASKFLSKQEEKRFEMATSFVILGIKEKLDNGFIVRKDDFFSSDEIEQCKAGKLFEGILLKCKDEVEENKISYISNIFKNVAFDDTINPLNANQILNLAQQLTYRQLSILALVGQNINNVFQLKVDHNENTTTEIDFLLQDFMQLYMHGLILCNYLGSSVTMNHISDVEPGNMKLTLLGQTYYNILNLDSMPKIDFVFSEILK